MEAKKIDASEFQRLCIDSKKSLPRIAEEAGVSYLTVWRLFTEKHFPKIGTAKKLGVVLGADVRPCFKVITT